nr:1-aminocyclopropane-1-carboxylate oxidase homolog 10-like isoform X3 [Setaria viridis]
MSISAILLATQMLVPTRALLGNPCITSTAFLLQQPLLLGRLLVLYRFFLKLLEWDAHATAEGCALLGLLSEGLRLGSTRLEAASCLEGRVMVCHYYLVCPEPKRTVGVVSHTDPGRLTLLAQDSLHKRVPDPADPDSENRHDPKAFLRDP